MHERPDLARMAGYGRGRKPIAPAAKLNLNETSLALSDVAMAALAPVTLAKVQRYPHPLAGELWQPTARCHDCAHAQIMAANGSDGFLRLAVTTFAGLGPPIGVDGAAPLPGDNRLWPRCRGHRSSRKSMRCGCH